MAGGLGSWAVPRRVLLLCVVATVVLVAPLAGTYLLAGVPAALGLGMGYLASVRAALNLRPLHALALTVPAAMAGAVAVALRGQPLAAAFFVALCCLLVAPANTLVDALLAGVPTAAAVLVSVPGDFRPWPTAVLMLAGGLVVVGLASRLGHAPSSPAAVPSPLAWRHAIVMAVAVGAVVFLVQLLEWPHGYWVALTLTVVLRPFDDQTRALARQRVLGTVGGVLLALLLATLLPVAVVAVALATCLVLTLAYTMVGDHARQVVFLTPSVVLLGSTGSAGAIAAERALYTVAGALVAVGIALALTSWDSARHAPAVPAAGKPPGTG